MSSSPFFFLPSSDCPREGTQTSFFSSKIPCFVAVAATHIHTPNSSSSSLPLPVGITLPRRHLSFTRFYLFISTPPFLSSFFVLCVLLHCFYVVLLLLLLLLQSTCSSSERRAIFTQSQLVTQSTSGKACPDHLTLHWTRTGQSTGKTERTGQQLGEA